MSESVFLRLENLLKERGVDFGVLRHQPVFTSEEAAAVRDVALSTGAKALICRVDDRFVRNLRPAQGLDSILTRSTLPGMNLLTQVTPGQRRKAADVHPLAGVCCCLLLSAGGSISFAADPYGVSPPSDKQWTVTFDDEFTLDTSINTNKWNGGAGGTDWCNLNFHGKTGGGYMFGETNDPCGQHYDGCTLSRTNGLEMRSSGAPSAALQTGGTTVQDAKFIQKFGYWEARFKVPHNTHGEGTGLHSDFWMHPIPEGLKSPTEWLPEINVGERPTWDANRDKANNQIYFGIHDYAQDGARKDNAYGGPYGTSPLTDLSADWHTYGLYWRDDGSGPYGSMQFYLDGKPLWAPYTLSSSATNMASGIYMFLLLDNDQKGGDPTNAFLVQYVRVWRLDPSNRSSSPSSISTPAKKKATQSR